MEADTKKVNLFCLPNTSGYGWTGYQILKRLMANDWDVFLDVPKRGSSAFSLQMEGDIQNELIQKARREMMFHYDAVNLTIWHQWDLHNSIGKGRNVAYTFFEVDHLYPYEKHSMNYVDELCVTCEWAKGVCENNGITTNINIVPLGVDSNYLNSHVFNPKFLNLEEERKKPTIFLNSGKWEVRKGHDVLYKIFNKAFNVDDNVELWMTGHNPYVEGVWETKSWESMYLDSPMGKAGKIKIFPWETTHEDHIKILNQCDCGIFPSRGEAWNLGVLELMGLGKDVIVTNYSGHTEFCNESNSHLIDIENLETAYDGKWFNNLLTPGNWADIGLNQIEQAAELMKKVHQKKQENGYILNEEGVKTSKTYTLDNTYKKMEEILIKNN